MHATFSRCVGPADLVDPAAPLQTSRRHCRQVVVTILTECSKRNIPAKNWALCSVRAVLIVLTLRIMQPLDGTDTRLLMALAQDPRRTVVALAQELGLSRNTVQARMNQLEKKSVFLSFDRRISPAALGYPLAAFIHIHVQQPKLEQITNELALIPEVLEAFGITGQADILARVVSTGAEDLFRINGKVLAIDGVERTDTSLAMHELVPFRIGPLLQRTGGPDPD